MKGIYNLPCGGLKGDGKFFLSSIINPLISRLGGTDEVD